MYSLNFTCDYNLPPMCHRQGRALWLVPATATFPACREKSSSLVAPRSHPFGSEQSWLRWPKDLAWWSQLANATPFHLAFFGTLPAFRLLQPCPRISGNLIPRKQLDVAQTPNCMERYHFFLLLPVKILHLLFSDTADTLHLLSDPTSGTLGDTLQRHTPIASVIRPHQRHAGWHPRATNLHILQSPIPRLEVRTPIAKAIWANGRAACLSYHPLMLQFARLGNVIKVAPPNPTSILPIMWHDCPGCREKQDPRTNSNCHGHTWFMKKRVNARCYT